MYRYRRHSSIDAITLLIIVLPTLAMAFILGICCYVCCQLCCNSSTSETTLHPPRRRGISIVQGAVTDTEIQRTTSGHRSYSTPLSSTDVSAQYNANSDRVNFTESDLFRDYNRYWQDTGNPPTRLYTSVLNNSTVQNVSDRISNYQSDVPQYSFLNIGTESNINAASIHSTRISTFRDYGGLQQNRTSSLSSRLPPITENSRLSSESHRMPSNSIIHQQNNSSTLRTIDSLAVSSDRPPNYSLVVTDSITNNRETSRFPTVNTETEIEIPPSYQEAVSKNLT